MCSQSDHGNGGEDGAAATTFQAPYQEIQILIEHIAHTNSMRLEVWKCPKLEVDHHRTEYEIFQINNHLEYISSKP